MSCSLKIVFFSYLQLYDSIASDMTSYKNCNIFCDDKLHKLHGTKLSIVLYCLGYHWVEKQVR